MSTLKEILEVEQIEYWLEKGNIRNFFDTPDLNFQAYCYEKGEYITVPDRQMDKILFLVEGTVQIYGVREDGSLSPINHIVSPTILGDLEFPNQAVTPFFTETKTRSVCHYLQRNIVNSSTMTFDFCICLFNHMKNICPLHEINCIETAIFQLRCSRRQLQRVLKKLCDCGKIEKMGKGKYKLIL